jgi:AAA+ ATPase superfamily predicted ATPase
MDILERIIPATDTPPGNPKKAMYRVADPYLSFWHHFVAPLRATGANELRAPMELWHDLIAPGLNEFMGSVFASASRSFVGGGDHERLPFRPVRVGEWWSDDSSEQVDVLAIGADGDVLIGECKWGAVGREDLAVLAARRDLIIRELRGVTRVHLALFSGAPVADAALRERIATGDVLHFSLDELYA